MGGAAAATVGSVRPDPRAPAPRAPRAPCVPRAHLHLHRGDTVGTARTHLHRAPGFRT